MWATEAGIDIAATPEAVYDYLADFRRHAEWSTGVEQVAVQEGGPVRVGAELETTEVVPARMTTRARVTALEPGRRIAWEATDGRMMKAEWAFELSPLAEGTHLVQRARFQPLTFAGRVILGLLRRRQIPGENARSLERIKANLEGVGGP